MLFCVLKLTPYRRRRLANQKTNEDKNRYNNRPIILKIPRISMTESEARELRQRMLLAINSSVASSFGMEAGGFGVSAD